jgi:hypothetical protein
MRIAVKEAVDEDLVRVCRRELRDDLFWVSAHPPQRAEVGDFHAFDVHHRQYTLRLHAGDDGGDADGGDVAIRRRREVGADLLLNAAFTPEVELFHDLGSPLSQRLFDVVKPLGIGEPLGDDAEVLNI